MRIRSLKILVLAAVLGLGLILAGGSTALAADGDAQLYTAYNIWWEQPGKVWSTNYQKGQLLPAGTAVRDAKQTRKSIQFTDVKTDVTYTIVFVPKHHPGKSIGDIYQRYITDKSLDQLTEGFSQSEKDAIKAGSVVNGMSKEAVLVCYGYPPEIATPNTKLDHWQYWRHRFKSYAIDFDEGGKVKYIGG
jgi:hypothetical protein